MCGNGHAAHQPASASLMSATPRCTPCAAAAANEEARDAGDDDDSGDDDDDDDDADDEDEDCVASSSATKEAADACSVNDRIFAAISSSEGRCASDSAVSIE